MGEGVGGWGYQPEPTETIIVHMQQNFEIGGWLNPVQIEIEDERVLNTLKRHKNAAYKLTPLVILFPASIKIRTELIFITCTELNNVKKSLINSKIYGLLGITDFFYKKSIIGTKLKDNLCGLMLHRKGKEK